MNPVRKIAVLGSTGSIGKNALDVVSNLNGRFEVTGLSCDSSIELLAAQARDIRPKIVSVGSESLAKKAKAMMSAGTKIVFGTAGLTEIVSRPDVDIVVFAISGSSCFIPLAEAIKKRKRIALANKESLISAGMIINALAEENNVKLIPIDSEHSAIFQCLNGRPQIPSRIYLTGSGGPLLNIPKDRFDKLPRKFMLNHPKWKMGRKISVDSATMMNKGLEIIEAKYLFDVDEDRIEVLIHPEAIVHSMVEFADGSVIAQLGVPDMRIPIQYALTYPERASGIVRKVDFARIGKLSFFSPDLKKFPCLGLARRAAKDALTAPAVLCAADEEAVKYYLDGDIEFSDIPKIIEKVLSRHKNTKRGPLAIGDILDADRWARQEARTLCCR